MPRRRAKKHTERSETFKPVRSLIEQAEEYSRIRLSARYFLENWWTIPRPKGGPVRLKPHPYQLDLLDDLTNNNNDLLILKARQIGFTTLMAGYMTWFALTEPGTKVIYFSQTHNLATGVIQNITNTGIGPLPEWLKTRMLGSKPEDGLLKESINFSNGSIIKAGVTRKSTGRSETAGLIVLDEWAFYDNPVKAWAAAQPAASEAGRVIAFSTANEDNQFYEQQWMDANDGLNGFTPRFYAWDANPRRDRVWYEEMIRKMPADERHREYPSTPAEAFTRSGSQVFPQETLERLPRPFAGTKGALFSLESGDERRLPHRNDIEFIPASGRQYDDRLEVWVEPDPPNVPSQHRFVIGVDTCFGTPTGDYAAATVIRDDSAVAAVYHARTKEHELAEMLAHLGIWYNKALILIETAGAGSGRHCAHLLDQEYRYPMLYRQPRQQQGGILDAVREPGWVMSPTSKVEMIARLNEKLLNPDLRLYCRKTQTELSHYLYLSTTGERKKMGAPTPLHDDLVISLGIAVWGLQYINGPQEYPEPEYIEPFSAAWFRETARVRHPHRRSTTAAPNTDTVTFLEATMSN